MAAWAKGCEGEDGANLYVLNERRSVPALQIVAARRVALAELFEQPPAIRGIDQAWRVDQVVRVRLCTAEDRQPAGLGGRHREALDLERDNSPVTGAAMRYGQRRFFVLPLAENTKHRNVVVMDDLQAKQQLVAAAAEKAGFAALAAAASVPLTTLYSLKKRDWQNKNVETFERLVAAARVIQDGKGAA